MQQPPGSCAHRAHSSWYEGIATRDFEELPCGKVGPCLELPLGGRQPSHPGCFGTNRIHRHRLVNSGLEITLTDRVPVTAISTENRNAARR